MNYHKIQELSTCNSVGLLSKLSRQLKGWLLLQNKGGGKDFKSQYAENGNYFKKAANIA